MYDKIEHLGNSLIQHGKNSNRIYLLKLAGSDYPGILKKINKLAYKNLYTKVFAKIPAQYADAFLADNYRIEAKIPGFYDGKQEGLFLGKYYNLQRKRVNKKELDKFKKMLDKKNGPKQDIKLNKQFKLTKLHPRHARKMTRLFKKVFDSYPFPVYKTKYIRKTMKQNIDYFGIWKGRKLVAVSSAEKDVKNSNVEMTDFAVNPEYRGNKFALFLLKTMEKEMKKQHIQTGYTIARLKSLSMNKTFLNMGYNYGGTLVNNTNISGSIESMNVLYKSLK